MNTVISKEENIEEFQWMSAVVEETVSTSNGEKSQVLSMSQKGEFSKNNTHIPFGSCIDSESGKKKIASKKKRKDKKAKDRVKKPLNAFMLYFKEKRAELVANSTIYKNSPFELSKVVGKLWHSLTDEQRAVYNAQACEERRRHALLHPSQPRPRKRRPSGFFRKCRAKYGMDSQHLWCANCRRKKKCLWLLKALAEENGGVLPKLPPRRKKPSKDSSEKNDSSLTISKAEFQWMPAVVEETVSTSNGEKSQDLPKSQKGEFSKNNTHISSGSCIDSESGKKKIASKKKRKEKKAKDRVKKPLNAFMLYLKEKRAELVANSTIYKNSSSELNKVVGKLWHSLTDEQRAAYYAQACEERRRHALLHPWKGPSQPRPRKRRPSGFFRKCRAKYGMDSQHLWCANCRRKQKCLWLLKALAEENGGVLPKLPPRRKKPSKDSSEKNDSSSTISKTGFFRKCRAKYGTDSQHLWCANCRWKKKCLWLLKALAEENGGVLPKLPPRRKKPSKDSSEKNDSSSTISKTDINLEKCRQKDNTELGNQETEPRSQKGKFSKNNTHIPSGSCFDSESGKKKIESKKKRKEKKAKDRVKKPLNAFMLYLKEKRAELVANSTIYKNSSSELNKVVGKLWHSLTDEQRAAYYAQACEERRRHALLHPWKGPSQPRPRKRRPSGFFRKCRAKYGMDSQHLWCANCRRKKKCLWLLKALAEENGGVLPKLPPRRKKPSKDSSEKNDSSLTISKADINLEKCRQKDNTELGNQETEPRLRREASPVDIEYNRYVSQQYEFTKFAFELNAKYDDDKSCLEMYAKEYDAKSCFEKNVTQDTKLTDNGKEVKIEPCEMNNEIEDFVPHTVKLEIIEYEETKIGGIASQAAAVEMIKVENIKEENIEL